MVLGSSFKVLSAVRPPTSLTGRVSAIVGINPVPQRFSGEEARLPVDEASSLPGPLPELGARLAALALI